jgi:adenylate cyclase
MAEEGEAAVHTAWVSDYEAGLAAYRARRWEEAIAAFARCGKARPDGDRASEMMIDHCRALKTNPPPADWSAVTVMGSK